jgi:hypothetical protein
VSVDNSKTAAAVTEGLRRVEERFNDPKTGVAAAVAAGLSAAQPPAPQPKPREEDPRARAARRALELREQASSDDDGVDKFFIDPRIIPDGWGYEWKTFTVLGKENPSYQVAMAHKGWEAVPRSRHPHLMPINYQGETIEREGMVLMERPLEITQEAKARDLRIARAQVRGKEEQLGGAPNGTFERSNKDQPLVKVKKSFENMPIPE